MSLTLLDWRRRVHRLYAAVPGRADPAGGPPARGPGGGPRRLARRAGPDVRRPPGLTVALAGPRRLPRAADRPVRPGAAVRRRDRHRSPGAHVVDRYGG